MSDHERIRTAAHAVRIGLRKAARAAGREPDGTFVPEDAERIWHAADASPSEIFLHQEDRVRKAERDASALMASATVGLAVQMNLHELNGNRWGLASSVRSLEELLSTATRSEKDVERIVASATNVARRARRISDGMDFFGTHAVERLGRTRKGSSIAEVLRKEFSRGIESGELAIEATDAFLATEIRFDQADAVFSNLVRNAYRWAGYGSKSRRKATVRLDAETFVIPPKNPDASDDEEYDRYPTTETVVSIEDDGPGIPEKDRKNVFAPFVSGRGSMGMGLHLCRSMVRRGYQSIVAVEPKSLGGARFEIGSRRFVDPLPEAELDPRDVLVAAAWSFAALQASGEGERIGDRLGTWADLARERMRIRIEGPRDATDVRLAEAADVADALVAGRIAPEDVDWPEEARPDFGGPKP